MARNNSGGEGEMGERKQGPLKGVLDFFLAGPDKKGSSPKPSKTDKDSKPKTAAQLRKERNDAKRKAKDGTRYSGGNRKYLVGAFAIFAALAILTPVSIMIGASKTSEDQVRAIVEEELTDSGSNFPEGQAVMWAGQVLRVWGTWDEENADAREVSIAPYLSSGMDSQAGWNAAGKQEITYASINPQPTILDANHAAVDAVYQIGDGSWRCVTIPVYAYKPDSFDTNAKWAFALAGNPTPTACAPRTGAPSVDDNVYAGDEDRKEDSELGETLSASYFPGFFSAWAASDADALQQYTASGVKTTGLGGAMASNPQPEIGEVHVWTDSEGVQDGVVYNAIVPVTWTVNGTNSRLSAEYLVQVKKEGERWFVAGEPQAAQQATDVRGGSPQNIPEPDDDVTPGEYPSSQETETPNPDEVNPNDSSESSDGGGE